MGTKPQEEVVETSFEIEDKFGEITEPREISTKLQKDHPITNIIGTPTTGVRTRSKFRNNLVELVGYMCYTSLVQ